jgi:hypothetical protein
LRSRHVVVGMASMSKPSKWSLWWRGISGGSGRAGYFGTEWYLDKEASGLCGDSLAQRSVEEWEEGLYRAQGWDFSPWWQVSYEWLQRDWHTSLHLESRVCVRLMSVVAVKIRAMASFGN